MTPARGQFTSRIGFLMAAAGSAVGLGNIWGFPTRAADNGGGAFVLAYLVMAFVIAYPALMAELTIGRYRRANVVTSLSGLGQRRLTRWLGYSTGGYAVLVASLILAFYTIVAGWMLASFAEPLARLLGADAVARWLAGDSAGRNLAACFVFSALTAGIIARGVEDGIEAWSVRLMPLLALILLGLIVYVLLQPGASEGLRVYLIPDLTALANPDLLLSALGQAFFSLSLGVGTMLIYGSYLKKTDSLPRLGASVTLLDTGIAFTAGLLILPAMFLAQHQGVVIYGDEGELVAGPGLIFQVLPALFESMGTAGLWVALAFFALMSIAALTSSISMLEVPVSLAEETTPLSRPLASLAIGLGIFAISTLLIFNMGTLFGWTIDFTTRYSQPLLGAALCLFAGWVMHRHILLEEIREGHPGIETSLFWKVWPFYVRFVCPALIMLVFVRSLI